MAQLACFLGGDLEAILEKDILVPVIAIICGSAVGIIAIVMSATKAVFVSRAREATKREMAAYVAEGTIAPDKAIAMLNAGESAEDAES